MLADPPRMTSTEPLVPMGKCSSRTALCHQCGAHRSAMQLFAPFESAASGNKAPSWACRQRRCGHGSVSRRWLRTVFGEVEPGAETGDHTIWWRGASRYNLEEPGNAVSVSRVSGRLSGTALSKHIGIFLGTGLRSLGRCWVDWEGQGRLPHPHIWRRPNRAEVSRSRLCRRTRPRDRAPAIAATSTLSGDRGLVVRVGMGSIHCQCLARTSNVELMYARRNSDVRPEWREPAG